MTIRGCATCSAICVTGGDGDAASAKGAVLQPFVEREPESQVNTHFSDASGSVMQKLSFRVVEDYANPQVPQTNFVTTIQDADLAILQLVSIQKCVILAVHIY